MLVLHFVLCQGGCRDCGKIVKGYVPKEYQTGYGPRLSALIAEIGGIDGYRRETIQTFYAAGAKIRQPWRNGEHFMPGSAD